jgi:hypothetical protein
VLVSRTSRLTVDAEELDQKQRYPFVDPWPNAAVWRIESIVEIEAPSCDVAKTIPERLVRRQAERRRRNQGRHAYTLVLRVNFGSFRDDVTQE